MKKSLFLLFWCAVSFVSLYSQDFIQGIVLDVNDKPISGVNVYLKGSTYKATTKWNGKYSLPKEHGKETVVFQKAGYKTEEFAINELPNIVTLEIVDLFDLSLEELMNIEVTVASPKARPVVEMPSIITLITEEDIRNSGARNLLEVLRLVPGIDFGAELDQVVGIGIRGNNSTEGKFLLMIDDQQMNETNYGSFDFGQHILLDNIERIEILRGPGSPIYGGVAELSVINIITKSGKKIDGLGVSAGSGYSHGGVLASNAQFCIGKQISQNLELSLSGHAYTGNRSNLKVASWAGDTLDYSQNTNFMSYNINFGLNYRDLGIRYIYDEKKFDNFEKQKGQVLFAGHFVGINYKWHLSEKLTLIPKFNWKMLKPWQFLNFPEYSIYNTLNNRYTANLTMIYETLKKANFVVGVEYFIDNGRKEIDTVVYISNQKREIYYSTAAAFAEANFFPKFANLTIGARLDYHNQYGMAFVPRLAMTKVMNSFHTKLMFSRAFKAPTIQNIDINPQIKPEKSNVAELEFGYRFTQSMQANINFFYIDINDAIVYLWDQTDHYVNYEKTGSRGLELDYRIRTKWLNFTLAYSFYLANPNNKVPDYVVENNKSIYGAFPNHKITTLAAFRIGNNFVVTPSFLFYSKRYTYSFDADWNAILREFEPTYLANIYMEYQNLLIKGLNVSFGVYDITDNRYAYINAYRAGVEPIYDSGREFFAKLSYCLKK